ncbi:MAG: hypothetical protein ACRD3W_05560 [Terriglobales bacterium]
MTTDTRDSTADERRIPRRIRWLIAAHIAADLMVAAFDDTWPVAHAELSGMFESAQIALLGIWLAMGGGAWQKRLAIGFAAVSALVFLKDGPHAIMLLPYMLDQFLAFYLPLAMTTWISAAGGLALIGKWWRDFEVVRIRQPAKPSSSIQFSIRSMLIATFLIALVLTFVRALRTCFNATTVESWWILFCAYAPVFAIYSAAAAVISVWAGLGASYLSLRVAATFAAQVALCLVLSLGITQSLNNPQLMSLVRSQFGETFIVLGSLLIMRSCGYRLLSEVGPSASTPTCDSTPDP